MARHAVHRDALLRKVENALREDECFVAAWLTGSFGRGEDDALSDIDITVVIDDAFAERLCARPRATQAGTTPERLELVRRFGEPLLIHEHHNNAPPGGSFTVVVYAGSAVAVDWTLLPRAGAVRPLASRLLLDQIGVPLAMPPAVPVGGELAQRLSERVAFFWMVAFPAVKALLRDDAVRFQHTLEMLESTRRDVEQLLAGELPSYRRDALTTLHTTTTERRNALRATCSTMLDLSPAVVAVGGHVPAAPMAMVDTLLGEAGATAL